ncbi:MAG: hypothetical protein WBP79_15885 [Candidatus Acidiferrales bacterium]
MSTSPKQSGDASNASRFHLSLDGWAVALALALSLLVWIGLIKHIPW